MAEILATIAGHVREQVARRRRDMSPQALRDRPLFHAPVRGFAKSLSGTSRRIIAEVKRASPSKGIIRQDFDPPGLAKDFAEHGASAVSVLTEERFFQGSLSHLEEIHDAVSLPLLCKDFMLDPYQLVEAKSYGAARSTRSWASARASRGARLGLLDRGAQRIGAGGRA